MTLVLLPATTSTGTILMRTQQNSDQSYAFSSAIEVGGEFVTEQNPVPVQQVSSPAPYIETPLGYLQLNVNSTLAQGFGTVPPGATFCYITVRGSGSSAIYRDDGTSPTSSLGMLITSNTLNWKYQGALSAIEFIATTGTATIDVSFYK